MDSYRLRMLAEEGQGTTPCLTARNTWIHCPAPCRHCTILGDSRHARTERAQFWLKWYFADGRAHREREVLADADTLGISPDVLYIAACLEGATLSEHDTVWALCADVALLSRLAEAENLELAALRNQVLDGDIFGIQFLGAWRLLRPRQSQKRARRSIGRAACASLAPIGQLRMGMQVRLGGRWGKVIACEPEQETYALSVWNAEQGQLEVHHIRPAVSLLARAM